MSVQVRIIDGALPEVEPNPGRGAPPGTVGAWVVFEGVVRGEESGAPIRGLEYEVYEPMASRMLREIGEDIAAARGLISMTIEHSRGEVAVGERSFRLGIASSHRAEAIHGMEEFIVRMKRDVPIWKTPR